MKKSVLTAGLMALGLTVLSACSASQEPETTIMVPASTYYMLWGDDGDNTPPPVI